MAKPPGGIVSCWDAAVLCGHLLGEGSVHAFLAEHRHLLFTDEMFAALFPSGRGPPPVPADVVATVPVLQIWLRAWPPARLSSVGDAPVPLAEWGPAVAPAVHRAPLEERVELLWQ